MRENDDLLRHVIQDKEKEINDLRKMLDFKISKIEPKSTEAIVFTFGNDMKMNETYQFYKMIRDKFPNNVSVGIPSSTILTSLSKDSLVSSIRVIDEALKHLEDGE